MPRFRDRLKTLVLLPLVVAAVAVLAYFTVRTTLQIDTLRQQSVLEATLGLATEKANRLDRMLIDQDNVIMTIVDPMHLEALSGRWLPTASRETPTVRAILVLDDGRTVQGFTSRATSSFADEESFRRLLTDKMLGDMELGNLPPDELHHLHRDYAGQSYLLSYWHRIVEGKRFLVIAWHDIGRLVRETMPTLYSEPDPAARNASRVNVVDEEGRIIYGPHVRSSEFTVGVRFPTTLYNWRVQISPAASEELAKRVENRRLLEITMVSISGVIIVLAAIALMFVSEKDRRVSALKSEFVANVSHELKTPLALVRMFAEMLQSGRVPSEAKRNEYLDIIVRESERLSALIENVLDFAKLERGGGDKSAYEFAEGDVGEAVSRAANVYRYRADRANVRLDVEIAEDLPRAYIDERAIGLAVNNLVDNALKYAPDGDAITIRARADEHAVRIEVSDKGPGVRPEDRTRIFERFVRLSGSDTSSDRVRGSGIGLALVKHIAESHGGKAWVESTSLPDENHGSTFVFTIPARPMEKDAPSGRHRERLTAAEHTIS